MGEGGERELEPHGTFSNRRAASGGNLAKTGKTANHLAPES
jgi:hypothetical protein